ncbi:MAG: DNA repair protein RecN [Muribaculaceae bacterium]|nr:DNA repair protein RecN [Muribaculaceae bacterium]
MLKSLFISNYALIDELEINFDKGLNIITGETGAGKSIILGALSLILGERANLQAMRDEKRKTIVEAVFDLKGYNLEKFFTENEIDDNGNECILRREVNANGRSRAFVNDSPVQLSLLKELATRLIDIHSQHSNMLLSSEPFQLAILDNIAGNQQLLEQYEVKYRELRITENEFAELQKSLAQSRSDEDYLRFQYNQLNELNLVEGEDEELEKKQSRLANASSLKEHLWKVQSLLDGENAPVIESLKQAAHHIEAVEQSLSELEGVGDRLNTSIIELKDISSTVAQLTDALNDDPQELERVENRLNAIYTLERKHNVDSVNALMELRDEYAQKLSAIDNSDVKLQEIELRLREYRDEALDIANKLSQLRRKAAVAFESQLKNLAIKLSLKNLNFIVNFKTIDLNTSGCDHVAFLVSFNKNQLPMLVRDTASGGEISRLMLCIKAIVAQNMNLPTMIFDEVDTGVSGDTASMVGELMNDISRTIQVIAITHLPQVAAHGNIHFKVYKTDTADATITGVKCLDAEERIMEIARMLSGRELNDAAIENAKSLINQNK